jgi:arabinogalactan endo-1,4-beta-galactosidase
MLVEVGMNAAPVNTAYNALVDILNKTKANGGLGVFYWEPAGYNNWKGYSKHCWLTNGRPTTALDAFLNAGNRLGSEDGSLENIQNELVIYPNPFTETLNIQLSGQAGELSIYDTAGRLVYTQVLNPEELNVIRLEGLTPGIYLSKVVDGSREITRTLVKN